MNSASCVFAATLTCSQFRLVAVMGTCLADKTFVETAPMAGGGLSGDGEVLDLVTAIYGAALHTEAWPDILNRIGDAIGGPQVVFGIYDPPNGIVNVHAPRTDPQFMRSLFDWAPSNPRLPCISSHPP